MKEHEIGKKDAVVLSRNLELVEFFEELVKEGIDAKKNLSWVTIELLRILNYNKLNLDDPEIDIKPIHLAELIRMIESGDLTVLKGKQIMNDFIPKSFSISEKGDIGKIADDAVKNICIQVIEQNIKAVEDYKSGNENSLNYLVGQVMKLSERRADFKIAREELIKLIQGE